MNKSLSNEDLYAGLGAVLTAILSALSWLWNISPLQFLFTFILGSLVTYFIQSRLQDRAEKRKITREIIEKIYGPIYVELQEIRECLINNLKKKYEQGFWVGSKEHPATWDKIKTYPEFFSVPMKLRDELDILVKKAVEINDSSDHIKRIVELILIEIGTEVFKPYYGKGTRISKDYSGYLWIAYKSKTDRTLYLRTLVDYIISNTNPVEDLKQRFSDFYPERCLIHMYIEEEVSPIRSPTCYHIDLPITQLQEDFNRFLETAKKRIVEEKEVSSFIENRDELSKNIDKLLPIIKKHIERHYPLEKI